jgi:hypothetical protein
LLFDDPVIFNEAMTRCRAAALPLVRFVDQATVK